MLPAFTKQGDLPPGVHLATWTEIEQRFGLQNPARVRAMASLRRVHELARRTGYLRKFYVFGSFVSARPEPRDVDVLLIMARAFTTEQCPPESGPVFAHLQAQARHAASVFWLNELAWSEKFLHAWQLKRDGTLSGIVEVA